MSSLVKIITVELNKFFLCLISVRLYEMNTLQCYVASNPREFHNGPITQVKDLKKETCKISTGVRDVVFF